MDRGTVARRAGHSRGLLAADPRSARSQPCRSSSTATTPTRRRPCWATRRPCCARPRRRSAGRAARADRRRRRAARLVQPGAAQHALSRAGPHRLHLDDHRRRVDGAVDRAREGERHDGAGADGADLDARRSSSARRCRTWCCRRSSAIARHPRGDGALRPADARRLGRRCSSSWRSSSSARSARVCSCRRWPTRSRWRFRRRCSSRFCRRSSCRVSSFRSRACRPSLQYITTVVPARYFLIGAARHRAEGADARRRLAADGRARACTPCVMLGLSAAEAGTTMRRRIAHLDVEGVPGAAADAAALRARDHRADHPADDARLRGDDRRQERADRRRRRRSLAAQPAADRARSPGRRYFTS